ncbi:MAG: hypothetical protein PVI92_12455 [Chromatiales bacterium]|jgi:3-oxoacyl-[acyl-carrier-protein] synthase-1
MTDENEALWLACVGAQTPLGLDAQSTVASHGGGIKRFTHNVFLRNQQQGEPFLIAELPFFDRFEISERMIAMGRAALDEALQGVNRPIESPLPVILSLPSLRPGFDRQQQVAVAKAIMQSLPCKAHADYHILIEAAHCGGMHAAAMAQAIMQEKKQPLCLVGAIDSAMESEYLNWLAGLNRLSCEDKPHGLIPGEGAAFILFATREGLDTYGIRPLSKISGLYNTTEPKPWYTNVATMGEGLTEAILGILGENRRTGLCYADLNGENWRHEEWQFAFVRAGDYLQSPLEIRHPADSYGDTGAATSLLLIILASYSFKNSCENHASSLIWTASDTRPWRSACFLEKCLQ